MTKWKDPYSPKNNLKTAARLAEADRLRKQGKTFEAIGNKMKLSRETVRQWLISKQK